MGLNVVSLDIKKNHIDDRVIALGGNPNVGKSTVFNELTGLKQHTGNWSGKTVKNAQGYCKHNDKGYVLVDLPGCYSLMAHSAEEEVARDFICFGNADLTVIVCDATCILRSMNLVLQTLEITPNVVVCINLMDEAKIKNIQIDIEGISKTLGVPVIGTSARSGKGLNELMDLVELGVQNKKQSSIKINYPDYIENAVAKLQPIVEKISNSNINSRFLSLMLINYDHEMHGFITKNIESNFLSNESIKEKLNEIKQDFINENITEKQIKDDIVSSIIKTADFICKDTVVFLNENYKDRDFKIDRILTGKWTAFPVMILALLAVFWITIEGANYPSKVIANFLFWIEGLLLTFFKSINTPKFIYEMLVLGVYRVLAWVVSVMLPPMAIFFPLFTLLEDVGFLPRIAFNLDRCFKKCSACGKQALTMCMGNL